MAHRDTNWPGTGDEDRRGSQQLHAAGQTPANGGGSAAGEEDSPARVASHARRRPRILAGELAGAREEGGTQARRPDIRSGALDLDSLDTLIVQQWTKTLRGPFDWAEWPLARYTLGADLLRALERRASAAVRCASPAATRLAWVCAMVACGRASRLRSLDPSPLCAPGGAQLVRADGARGWRCNLERHAPTGPQLRYWIHPSGLVEFEGVVRDDEPCPA